MNRSELARLILSDPARAKREAARIVERPRLEKPKAPRKTGILPRGKEKAAARKARNDRMAALRAEVFEKSDGTCAGCGFPIYIDTFHAHHLLSGVGVRRAKESIDTLAPVCPKCHAEAHDGDIVTLRMLGAWCLETGRHGAALALSKRISKLEESRESRRSGGETAPSQSGTEGGREGQGR